MKQVEAFLKNIEDYEKHKADFQAPQELMFCGLYVEGEIEK